MASVGGQDQFITEALGGLSKDAGLIAGSSANEKQALAHGSIVNRPEPICVRPSAALGDERPAQDAELGPDVLAVLGVAARLAVLPVRVVAALQDGLAVRVVAARLAVLPVRVVAALQGELPATVAGQGGFPREQPARHAAALSELALAGLAAPGEAERRAGLRNAE